MAWRPAIPAQEYGKYFTVRELGVIFQARPERLRKMAQALIDDPNRIFRIYWKAKGHQLQDPEVMFHLEDVWQYGPEFGITVPREWITEVLVLNGWHNRKWDVAGVVGGGFGTFMKLEKQ